LRALPERQSVSGDETFMRAALEQALIAESAGEVPIGAIVVVGGEIVGHGYNRSIADHDPSGHAEVVALRAAGIRLGNHRIVGGILYVTVEPCPMCTGAIVQARIARVVFGCTDPKAGAPNHRAEMVGGVMAEECAATLRDFFQLRRGGKTTE